VFIFLFGKFDAAEPKKNWWIRLQFCGGVSLYSENEINAPRI
jgi:hypothetical protein